jgi:hypothetical protein
MDDKTPSYREVWDAERREYITVCTRCFPDVMKKHLVHPKQPFWDEA